MNPTALTAELRERARETVTIWFRTQWPTSTLDPHRDGDYKKLTRAIETTLLALRDAARAEQREQDATALKCTGTASGVHKWNHGRCDQCGFHGTELLDMRLAAIRAQGETP